MHNVLWFNALYKVFAAHSPIHAQMAASCHAGRWPGVQSASSCPSSLWTGGGTDHQWMTRSSPWATVTPRPATALTLRHRAQQLTVLENPKKTKTHLHENDSLGDLCRYSYSNVISGLAETTDAVIFLAGAVCRPVTPRY